MTTTSRAITHTRASECLLITLNADAPPNTAAQLRSHLATIHGTYLLEAAKGRAMLVLVTPEQKTRLMSFPYIESIGGVTVTPRKLVRIRVKEALPGGAAVTYRICNNRVIRVEELARTGGRG